MYSTFAYGCAVVVTVLAVAGLLSSGIRAVKRKHIRNDAFPEITDKIYWCVFGVLLFVAAVVRFYRITELPEGLHIDEAGMAYDAYCLANYGVERFLNKWPVYLINYQSGQSALYAYMSALFMKVFGASYYAVRMPAFVMGMCVVFFGTLLAKEAVGKRYSLVMMVILTFCPYFIMASRWGFDCNLMLGCATTALYFSVLAVRKSGKRYFALAGILWGITLYSYSLSWLAIPGFLLICMIYLLYVGKLQWKQIFTMAVPLFVLAVPLLLFVAVNTFELEQIELPFMTITRIPYYRSGSFSLANIKDNLEIYKMLLTKDVYSFDAIDYYYTLFMVSMPLFVYGAVVGIVRVVAGIIKRKMDVASLIVLFFMVVYFCMLIVEGPCIYRSNGIYYSMAFLLVLAIQDIVSRLPWQKWVLACFVTLYLMNGAFFIRYYFVEYEDDYDIQWFMYDHLDDIFVGLANADLTGKEVYIDNYNGPSYTMDCFLRGISPYDYNKENDMMTEEENLGNYHYYLPDPSLIQPNGIYVVFDYNWYKDYFTQTPFSSIKYGYFTIYYME